MIKLMTWRQTLILTFATYAAGEEVIFNAQTKFCDGCDSVRSVNLNGRHLRETVVDAHLSCILHYSPRLRVGMRGNIVWVDRYDYFILLVICLKKGYQRRYDSEVDKKLPPSSLFLLFYFERKPIKISFNKFCNGGLIYARMVCIKHLKIFHFHIPNRKLDVRIAIFSIPNHESSQQKQGTVDPSRITD